MQKRTRLFFFQNISVKMLSKMLFYNILYRNIDKQKLTGRDLQKYIYTLSDNYWEPGNDTTYSLLHEMEQEYSVISSWNNKKDENKRYKRLYTITDKGIEEYEALKRQYIDLLNSIIDLCCSSISFLYSKEPIIKKEAHHVIMSSTIFQEVNILEALCLQKSFISGMDITRFLQNKYHNWKPSFGVLYPTLSKLSSLGYSTDRWSIDEIDHSNKKRTIREYKITKNGRDKLDELKYNTDFYIQLNKIKNMFENFLQFTK